MRFYCFFAILALAISAPAQNDEDQRETVVVAALRSKPLISGIEVLTEELRTQVTRHGAYRLVTPEEMDAVDGELQRQLAGGCDEASCIAELGGALGARYLITGRLGQLGKLYSLNLKLVDIEKVSAKNAASAHGSSIEEFLPRMPAITAQLLGVAAPASPTGAAPEETLRSIAEKGAREAVTPLLNSAIRAGKVVGDQAAKEVDAAIEALQKDHLKHSFLGGIGYPSPSLGGRYEWRPKLWLQPEVDLGVLVGFGPVAALGLRIPLYGRLDKGFSVNGLAKSGAAVSLGVMRSVALAASYKFVVFNTYTALVNFGAGTANYSDDSSSSNGPFFELAMMLGKSF